MKNIAPILFVIVFIFACKKETTVSESNKYDLSVTIKMSVPSVSIGIINSSGNIDSMILSNGGVNYSYGSVKKGTELKVYGQSLKPDSFGFVKCIWMNKEVVQKIDSFWVGGDASTFNSKFIY